MAVAPIRQQPDKQRHTYEEIRKVVAELLSEKVKGPFDLKQYNDLRRNVTRILHEREGIKPDNWGDEPALSEQDRELLREVFWDFFRQGVILLGVDDDSPMFPHFRVSSFGKKMLVGQDPYFFHDASTYEQLIKSEIPQIDPLTLVYLKEAVQAFYSGCMLSATVMIGVSIEHSFLRLLDVIENNRTHQATFRNAFGEKTILRKFNKFKNVLDTQLAALPSEIKEDLDTNFAGILSMIRNFRNESGHPSGKIISREQCFVLLPLFVPCCKKVYQLIDHYK
jgi:hypothetical protein